LSLALALPLTLLALPGRFILPVDLLMALSPLAITIFFSVFSPAYPYALQIIVELVPISVSICHDYLLKGKMFRKSGSIVIPHPNDSMTFAIASDHRTERKARAL
jgi:hypothetical protein